MSKEEEKAKLLDQIAIFLAEGKNPERLKKKLKKCSDRELSFLKRFMEISNELDSDLDQPKGN